MADLKKGGKKHAGFIFGGKGKRSLVFSRILGRPGVRGGERGRGTLRVGFQQRRSE